MEWLTPEVVSTIGFPIVLCTYLIIRMEKVLNNLSETVRGNSQVLNMMFDYFIKEGD